MKIKLLLVAIIASILIVSCASLGFRTSGKTTIVVTDKKADVTAQCMVDYTFTASTTNESDSAITNKFLTHCHFKVASKGVVYSCDLDIDDTHTFSLNDCAIDMEMH